MSRPCHDNPSMAKALPSPLAFSLVVDLRRRRRRFFDFLLAAAASVSLCALLLHINPPFRLPALLSLRPLSSSPSTSCSKCDTSSFAAGASNRGRSFQISPDQKQEGRQKAASAAGGSEPTRTEFKAYGTGAALFVLYSAYRGGGDTFAVVGLSAKALYVYGEPTFECYWEEDEEQRLEEQSRRQRIAAEGEGRRRVVEGKAMVMLPDQGYGRVYTTVVVNCTFGREVGGVGQLVLYAAAGPSNDPLLRGQPAFCHRQRRERIVALTETVPYDPSLFRGPPYRYDAVYCGSPLYGPINARRLSEWVAYHVRLLGERSHLVLQDAGGVGEAGRAALRPWMEAGRVTLLDVTAEGEFDGYYHNQFLLVNDCLHRTRFLANWTFFFDVDEFLYVDPALSLYDDILSWHANDTVLSFQQLRMSDSVCLPQGADATENGSNDDEDDGRWVFEKLVYGESFTDTKYAIQARHVFATGVHYPQKELGHMEGNHGWAWWPQMHFYHYHNTISKHGKLCTNITNDLTFSLNGHNYTLDTSMVPLGAIVRQFEKEYIHTST